MDTIANNKGRSGSTDQAAGNGEQLRLSFSLVLQFREQRHDGTAAEQSRRRWGRGAHRRRERQTRICSFESPIK